MTWERGRSVAWKVKLPFETFPHNHSEAEKALYIINKELDQPEKYSASERLWLRNKLAKIQRFINDDDYRDRMCSNYNIEYDGKPKQRWEGYAEWCELIKRQVKQTEPLSSSELYKLAELTVVAAMHSQGDEEKDAHDYHKDLEEERKRRASDPNWHKRPHLRWTELGDPPGESAFIIPPFQSTPESDFIPIPDRENTE